MRGRLTVWMRIAAFAGVMTAAGTAAAEPPEAFPNVPLTENSTPRYGVVSLDAWDASRLAYLMFDGNVTDGFGRVYVWIPGDREYGTPVARNANRDNEFPTLEFRSRNEASGAGAREALIRWNLRYRRHRHSGVHRYFDYGAGEWVERGSGQVTYSPRFDFACDVLIGPRTGAAISAARMPLNLSIPGSMRVATTWEELPPTNRPWDDLRFHMRRVAQRERRRAVVRFQSRLQLHSVDGWRDVTVHALPPEAEIRLVIKPYMQEPVFDEVLPFAEAFGEGRAVDLPFAWYEYEWTMACPDLTIRPRRDEHVTLIPQPLGPDDFE